jgi:S-adenosylmethionine decarboxylase
VTAPAAAGGAGASAVTGDGIEWVVEAFDAIPGASPASRRLVDAIVAALDLTPVGVARWHQFPAPAGPPAARDGVALGTPPAGGVTGLVLLAESHLAVHTFPEHGSLCLNLFCCRPRAEWDFAAGLAAAVGAGRVRVRRVARPYAAAAAPVPA